jgi:hypothetical protein
MVYLEELPNSKGNLCQEYGQNGHGEMVSLFMDGRGSPDYLLL